MTPNLGLVCITRSKVLRFRTVTRTRYLSLPPVQRERVLSELYDHNLSILFNALDFCKDRDIHLYRISANLFPLSDWEDGVGDKVLDLLSARMSAFGKRAAAFGIRVVIHPDQFVVLSSERPEVVQNSVAILEHLARLLDDLGLPCSSFSAMTIHGGKGGRPQALAEALERLSPAVRSRLTLENDERAYGARDILEVCRAVGVPMVFDAHHHVVREGLEGFGHPSVLEYTRLARQTWQPAEWQLVHLSNGRDTPRDARHSDFISETPEAFREVSWIEVEAKAKEEAILALRASQF